MTVQRQRYLKAKIAMALYDASGHVPKEADIEQAYRLTCVLYEAVFGRQYLRKRHKMKSGQLGLF